MARQDIVSQDMRSPGENWQEECRNIQHRLQEHGNEEFGNHKDMEVEENDKRRVFGKNEARAVRFREYGNRDGVFNY